MLNAGNMEEKYQVTEGDANIWLVFPLHQKTNDS